MHLLPLVGLASLVNMAMTSPVSINLPARDGPGETTVCRSTMDIGPCETISANSACISFINGLGHNIRNVYQAYGSTCKYYDGSCDVPVPVMVVNSHKHAVHVSLDKGTGDRINAVKCQDQWLSDAENTFQSPTVMYPRSLSSSSSATLPSPIPPRDTTDHYAPLRICDAQNHTGNCSRYTAPDCAVNPFGDEAIRSFSIDAGFQCAFYPARGCRDTNGPPHHVSTVNGTYVADKVDFAIGAMECMRWIGLGLEEEEEEEREK